MLSGDVSSSPQTGAALSVGMIVVMVGVLLISSPVRAPRWCGGSSGDARISALGGWVVLTAAAIFFIVPLVMTVLFSLWEGHGHYGLSVLSLAAARGRTCCRA